MASNMPADLAIATSSQLLLHTTIVEAAPAGLGALSLDPRFVAPSLSDYRLRSDSPAIDLGGLTDFLPLVTDLSGLARPLDGDLDGVARSDLGAFEFEAVTLTPPSDLARGQALPFLVEGPSYLMAAIAIGSEDGLLACAPYGMGRFNFYAPNIVMGGTSPLPHTFMLTVPAGVPPRTEVIIQGIGIDVLAQIGNITRAFKLMIP